MTQKKRIPAILPVLNKATLSSANMQEIGKTVQLIARTKKDAQAIQEFTKSKHALAKNATKMIAELDTYGHPELRDTVARLLRNTNSAGMLLDMANDALATIKEEISTIERAIAIEAAARIQKKIEKQLIKEEPVCQEQGLRTEECTQ